MINKYQQLGNKLSGKEMKKVQGGYPPCKMITCGGEECCPHQCLLNYQGMFQCNAPAS